MSTSGFGLCLAILCSIGFHHHAWLTPSSISLLRLVWETPWAHLLVWHLQHGTCNLRTPLVPLKLSEQRQKYLTPHPPPPPTVHSCLDKATLRPKTGATLLAQCLPAYIESLSGEYCFINVYVEHAVWKHPVQFIHLPEVCMLRRGRIFIFASLHIQRAPKVFTRYILARNEQSACETFFFLILKRSW